MRTSPQLRQRYSNWLIIVFIVLTVIVFLIGLIGGLTLEKFVLAVLTPLTPAFVFGCRQYIEHKEAATRLDQLRENAEALLQEVKRSLVLMISRQNHIAYKLKSMITVVVVP